MIREPIWAILFEKTLWAKFETGWIYRSVPGNLADVSFYFGSTAESSQFQIMVVNLFACHCLKLPLVLCMTDLCLVILAVCHWLKVLWLYA